MTQQDSPSRQLLDFAESLLESGQQEIAHSLPDAIWLASLLPAEESPSADEQDKDETETEKPSTVSGSGGSQIGPGPSPGPEVNNDDDPARFTPPPIDIEPLETRIAELENDKMPIGMLVPDAPENEDLSSIGHGPSFDLPAPPGLANPHEFGRRLKPLRKFRRNFRKPEPDELRTVERVCDEDIWDVVLKYPFDRCLNLSWIVDSSSSMDLWRQTGQELFTAIERSGAFRSIQSFEWQVDEAGESQFCSLDLKGKSVGNPRRRWPSFARDQVCVIFADCSSERWFDSKVRKELAKLTKTAQLLIVNPLPERMWSRTALRRKNEVDFRSPIAAAINDELRVVGAASESNTKDCFSLLAVAVNPGHLFGWSRFVAGQRAVYPGFRMQGNAVQPTDTATNLTGEERLERFRRYASRGGRELARLASALPVVTPRFIRLVRQRMLPERFQRDGTLLEAELLLGPLLRERTGEMLGKNRIYEFYPGVQELLLDQARTAPIRQVFFQFVAYEVNNDLSRSSDPLNQYAATVLNTGEGAEKCKTLPLSEAPTELILKRLGGEYLDWLEETKQSTLKVELNAELNRAQAALRQDSNRALEIVQAAQERLREEQSRWGAAYDLAADWLRLSETIAIASGAKAASQASVGSEVKLSSEEIADLGNAVLETFKLQEFLALAPKEAQVEIVPKAALEKKIESVLGWANTTGQIVGLVRELLTARPDSKMLREIQARVVEQFPDALRIQFGQPFTEPTTRMKFAPIPAGEFMMGSPEEESDRHSDEVLHRVILTRPFWMGVYPVTQDEYEALMRENPARFEGGRRPVENVSWNQAVEFCQKLSARHKSWLPHGYEFRLPTEAEWEYSCRAGTKEATYFGDSMSSKQANFNGNHPYNKGDKGSYLKRTTDVGEYEPNDLGLFDMHGNVWEWCLDHTKNDSDPDTLNAGIEDPYCKNGRQRECRGGSWLDYGMYCRSAYRSSSEPSDRGDNLGFRVCLARVKKVREARGNPVHRSSAQQNPEY